MASALPATAQAPEQTSPEVKRYERQKLTATIAALVLTLCALAVLALLVGPSLDAWLRRLVGDNRWVRLTILAFLVAVGLELLTLPLDFWSGYILEHRYQLSNLTLRGWIWRRIKGYLVGGPLGLALLLGLYSLLWFSGPWWWMWTAAA